MHFVHQVLFIHNKLKMHSCFKMSRCLLGNSLTSYFMSIDFMVFLFVGYFIKQGYQKMIFVNSEWNAYFSSVRIIPSSCSQSSVKVGLCSGSWFQHLCIISCIGWAHVAGFSMQELDFTEIIRSLLSIVGCGVALIVAILNSMIPHAKYRFKL